MPEPVLNPVYWRGRIEAACEPHHSIFKCPKDRWERIADRHRSILRILIKHNESVFDAGCGYGRLLTLMPPEWIGDYLGVDLSPDMIKLADEAYPERKFWVKDLCQVNHRQPSAPMFDWAILISIRPMIKRNAGDDLWAVFEANVRRWARKLLYLEYDENDKGSVE